MRTLKLNNEYDLSFSKSGYLEWVEPPQKYEQDIKVILKTNLGENRFHENMGVNWFQIFDYPTKNNVRDGIKSALSQYSKPVVIERLEIEERKDDRAFDVYLVITVEDIRQEVSFIIG